MYSALLTRLDRKEAKEWRGQHRGDQQGEGDRRQDCGVREGAGAAPCAA